MSNENNPNEILRKGVQEFEEYLKGAPDEIEKTHGPIWNARYELAKNIVSLSSASLVLTVTFSKSITDPNGPFTWKYLLFGSWLALLLSLISAILSLWVSIKLKTFGARFFNQRAKIRGALDSLDLNKPDPLKGLRNLVDEVLVPLSPVDVWQGRFLNLSLIMFIVALALLGAFGWKQFAT
jgi:hypothetical protein